jgi:phosphatidylglycerol---prolipoprotein diacylglyceryl transferase
MQLFSYGFFVILALIVVFVGTTISTLENGFKPRKIFLILLITSIFSFIGARSLYLYTDSNLLSVKSNFWDLSFHGFSLYGGLILAGISGFIMTKILRINRDKIADLMSFYIGIGIAIIRIGCFIHGCCFGIETNLPWGVRFPAMSPAHLIQLTKPHPDLLQVRPVHPTQIYEMIAALLGSLLTYFIMKKKAPNGVAFLAFLIWFTSFRWFDYYLRQPSLSYHTSPYFYPVIYLIIILSGVTLVYRRLLKSNL